MKNVKCVVTLFVPLEKVYRPVMEEDIVLVGLSLAEAQNKLFNSLKPLSTETLAIMETLGRVSFQDLTAPWNMPPYHQSAVDGFAVHADDKSGQAIYDLKEYLNDGDIPGSPLEKDQTVGVKTGGPIPEATTAVIPWEQAAVDGTHVSFKGEIKTGNNIKLPGEDFREGEIFASSGTIIDAALISLMAAFGIEKVSVYRRPKVAILSLGKQIVPYSSDPMPGQIRDSNGPLLASYIAVDGGQVDSLKYSGDQGPMEVEKSILEIVDNVDLLLTTGGTYSGTGDESRLLFEKLGAKNLFWDVPIQPGGHNGAALLDSTLMVSLSGNPAACMVGYQLFVAPVLRAVQGIEPYLQRVTAQSTNSYPRKGGPHRFLRGYARCGPEGWKVSALPGQKPGMLRSLINCNALIELPAKHLPLEAGMEVSVILLNPSSHIGNTIKQ